MTERMEFTLWVRGWNLHGHSAAILRYSFVAFADTIFEHSSCASCHTYLLGTTYRTEQAHALRSDLFALGVWDVSLAE